MTYLARNTVNFRSSLKILPHKNFYMSFGFEN
jgi:hypothetical protein